MIDYQNDMSRVEQLLQDIEKLKEENHFLKEEIRRLNARLTGLNSINNQVNINSPLVDYYINRYLEIHNYVLNARISILDEDIKKTENNYEELTSREDMLEEIAKRNQDLTIQIEELNEKIKQSNLALENEKAAFQTIANKVTDLENNLYYATLDYYNNLVSKLSIGNITETLEYMNFVIDVLKYTLYDEVVKYLDDAKNALIQLDDLNVLEYEVKNQNITYENEKKILSESIEVISFEETEKKLDALAYEITTKKTTRTELLELFANLKKQHIKAIKDEIKHLQILEYTNQQIALKMDDIVLNYKNSLSSADTSSNILLNKKLMLKKLNDKMEIIKPFKDKYDKLNDEYNQIQAMYKTITNNIDEIENYISDAKKIMDANQSFIRTIKEYSETKTKLDSMKMSLDSIIIREKNLAEARKQILNDPYGKTDLIRIDEELKIVQESIESFNIECRQLESKIYQLKETEQDYKIIMIYEEYLLCEDKLPKLYDKQRTLSSLISDKYVEVSNAKMKCNEYESLVKQIEEVEDEINNF